MIPRCKNTDKLVQLSIKRLKENGYLKKGDRIIVTVGVQLGVAGTTNMILVRDVV